MFEVFVAALKNHAFEVTKDSVAGSFLLNKEFGFRELSVRLSRFDDGVSPVPLLEERIFVLERDFSVLERSFSQQSELLSGILTRLSWTGVKLRPMSSLVERLNLDIGSFWNGFLEGHRGDPGLEVGGDWNERSGLTWALSQILGIKQKQSGDKTRPMASGVEQEQEYRRDLWDSLSMLSVLRHRTPVSRFTDRHHVGDSSTSANYTAADTCTGKTVFIRNCRVEHAVGFGLVRQREVLAGNDQMKDLPLVGILFTGSSSDPEFEIVTPFQENGTMKMRLEAERSRGHARLNATEKPKAIFGVVRWMAHLHSRGILHLDLNPAAVLVDGHLEPVFGGFRFSRHRDNRFEENP
jgi:hypothetical protein